MSAPRRTVRRDRRVLKSQTPSILDSGSPRGMFKTALTPHARQRGDRRNVAPDAVDYVLAHGRIVQRTGVSFYFLGRRDVPPADRCANWASRLAGTIVLVAANGSVITVYRNQHGLHTIQRKIKHRIPTITDGPRWDEAS